MRHIRHYALGLLILFAGVLQASNFVDDNGSLPATKTDRFPVTIPTQQWSASDANTTFQALRDIRTVLTRGVVNVKSYGSLKASGVVADGTDDTAAIQAAIDATSGKTLYFPRGLYKVSAPLIISTTHHHLVGDFAQRAGGGGTGGTEIQCSHGGVCLQIGADNGHAWDASDYDGPQDHVIEHMWFSNSSSDTTLASVGVPSPDPTGPHYHYKAGSTGLWDWRGGGVILRDVGFEHFEASFAGINSDLNLFTNVASNYSKYGIYLGPRSDQNRIFFLTAIYSDRVVTIDRAGQTEITGGSFVFCGTGTSSHIEIRRGSHGVFLSGNWHENSGAADFAGYQLGMQGFVSAGEVSGYGAGGSIQSPGAGTTFPVAGVTVDAPHIYSLPAGAGHTKYLVSVGFANQVTLRRPSAYIQSGLSSLDALVAIQAGAVPTTSDTQVSIYDVPDGMSRTQQFQNLGGGAVTAHLQTGRKMDSVELGLDTTATVTMRGAVTTTAPSGGTGIQTTNSSAGQTVGSVIWRLVSSGSYDTTAGALFPVALSISDTASRSAGASSVGKTGISVDVLNGQSNLALTTVRGDVRLNTSSGILEMANAIYESKEIAPTTLAADQTAYNPTSLSTAAMVRLTSSAAVNINTMALDANSANGRRLFLYNDNAAGGFNITLKDEGAALGSASQRFVGVGHADTVLTPGTGHWVYYSATKSRIIVL